MRAGDRQHGGMRGADGLGFLAHAAGHDHAAVLGDRLADRLQAFLLGAVEKAAGVDQYDIGAGIIGAHGIAIGAQPGEDAFGIDQRLGAAQADHADLLLLGQDGGGGVHDCARPYTRQRKCASTARFGTHRGSGSGQWVNSTGWRWCSARSPFSWWGRCGTGCCSASSGSRPRGSATNTRARAIWR